MCLAIPAQVVRVTDSELGLALVDVGGLRRNVSLALVEGEVQPGDWVLIHVGFALARVDEAEAQATLRLLEEMGPELEAELDELRRSAI